jgi:hypothetical protein
VLEDDETRSLGTSEPLGHRSVNGLGVSATLNIQ